MQKNFLPITQAWHNLHPPCKGMKTTEQDQLCAIDFQINGQVWERLQAQERVAEQKVKRCFDSPMLLLVCKDWLSEL